MRKLRRVMKMYLSKLNQLLQERIQNHESTVVNGLTLNFKDLMQKCEEDFIFENLS